MDSGKLTLDFGSGKKRNTVALTIVLAVYSLLTLIPFYVLAIRSFVPTAESMELHLWIPKPAPFNMESELGNTSVYFSMDIETFKKHFGIDDYLDPYLTFRDICAKYRIAPESMKAFMDPFIRFNGWFSLFSNARFVGSLLSTVFVTATSLLIGGLLGMATGSVLARFTKRWHMFVYNLYMLQIIIPPVMIMVPLYLIVSHSLHLYNTYWSLVLLNLQGGALSTMLFTSHIATFPQEMQESVEIDGGNRLHYFFSIVVPLCQVPMATFMVIMIRRFWNELLYGFLFLRKDKYTLIPFISSLSGENQTNFQAIYAGLIMSIVPVFVFYLVFQNLFIRSSLSGAVKG